MFQLDYWIETVVERRERNPVRRRLENSTNGKARKQYQW
jgi:hypothetical protein